MGRALLRDDEGAAVTGEERGRLADTGRADLLRDQL